MTMIKSTALVSLTATRFFSLLKLLIVVSAGVLASACGSDSSSSTASTPNPTVEGPIAGAPTLLGGTSFNLADVGYQQDEYFISGNARSYTNTEPLQSDGKWSVRIDSNADFKTRIVVYKPIDLAAFNGTVVIEWLNATGATDAAPIWVSTHNELIRKGYVWVGVSVQEAGIDGAGFNIGAGHYDLKTINPTRYGSLVHPGDKYSFDMFSQVSQAVLHPVGTDPLAGLHVRRAIASGDSQSANFLVTYVNAFAPLAKLFDGYFLKSRFHGAAMLSPTENQTDATTALPLDTVLDDLAAGPAVKIRDDLGVPVMMVQTETDLLVLGSYPDRQPDSSNFRLWEIAGAAHTDASIVSSFSDLGTDPNSAAVVEVTQPYPGFDACGKPVNSMPLSFVESAAMAALDNWLRNGVAPAYANRLEVAENPQAFVMDSVGNVLGGVRTPYVDVPIATLSGLGQPGTTFTLCSLFGTTKLFDSTQLASLYPDHATYVSAVNASVDSAVRSGFLLQHDGDLIKAWAQASSIGTP